MKKLLSLTLAIVLIGCEKQAPILQPITISPIIQFQTPNLRDKDIAEEGGLDLWVNIYATNKDIVFLFGSMETTGQPLPMQSTLLRSKDGGEHWQEAMHPLKTGIVEDFFMLKSGVGWALTWDLENGYSLYKSNN